ncbi:MAG: hypothetical protein J6U54_01180 [Clostridiales bacterium]|nr:hypothetical protein [Clostridiales bacterium]
MAKKTKKNEPEQTVVMTLEATWVLKGEDCVPKDEITLDASSLKADKLDIKNIKVFERE